MYDKDEATLLTISVYSCAVHQLLCFRLNFTRQMHGAIIAEIVAATVNTVLSLHLPRSSKNRR